MKFEEISKDEPIQALFLHGTGVMVEGTIGRATYNLIFSPNQEIRCRLASLKSGDKAGLASILDPVTIEDYETVVTGRELFRRRRRILQESLPELSGITISHPRSEGRRVRLRHRVRPA